MRKTGTGLVIVLFFIACNSKPTIETDAAGSVIQADTVSSLTDKSVEINMNGVSDTIIGSDGKYYVKVDPDAPVVAVITNKTNTAKAPVTKTTSASSSANQSAASSVGTGSESSTGAESSTPAVAKKKGWSTPLKGAVIGAGTGAVAGAIIGKNKVKGAVIGGLIGAGGGYVVGKVIDKKADSARNQR